MRAGWFILSVSCLAVTWGAADAHAQAVGAAVEAAVDQHQAESPGTPGERMAELAQRLAEPGGPPATPEGGVSDVALSPVERMPLGTAAEASRQRANPAVAGDTPPQTGGLSGGWMLSTLAALGVVIGLIFLFRFGYAKVAGTPVVSATSAIEVLGRTSVAPRSHVLLLRVGGRILVVGESAGGLRTLSEVTQEEEVAQLFQAVESTRPQSIAGGFNALLGRFNRDFGDPADATDPLTEGGDASEHRVDRARDSVSALAARLRLRSRKGEAA